MLRDVIGVLHQDLLHLPVDEIVPKCCLPDYSETWDEKDAAEDADREPRDAAGSLRQ
jgi:hypothetical protein